MISFNYNYLLNLISKFFTTTYFFEINYESYNTRGEEKKTKSTQNRITTFILFK